MKIKYTEPKTLIEVETTLLDVLNWENDIDRKNFIYEKGPIKIDILFWEDFKVIDFKIRKIVTARFSDDKLTPEQVVESIESLIKTLGVTYEN